MIKQDIINGTIRLIKEVDKESGASHNVNVGRHVEELRGLPIEIIVTKDIRDSINVIVKHKLYGIVRVLKFFLIQESEYRLRMQIINLLQEMADLRPFAILEEGSE